MKTIALTAFVALVLAIHQASAITLAEKGQSDYRIVVATNALPSTRYAAEELQAYLEKIAGAKLPIVTDAEKPRRKEILIGDSARLRKLEPKLKTEAVGRDGYVLRTDGSRLIIAGDEPRGTLYGVYSLLEEKLGVRWFRPDLEVVPSTNRVVLPKLNETFVPKLEYREVFWNEMMRDPDFAARHRLNGNCYGLAPKHGGRAVVYHPFVHSMDSLVPQSLFAEHPEYFPFRDGKRINGYVQRCLTNPDVLKLAIATVRQWIREHPEASVISVSQNDCAGNCLCEKCKAIDDAEGTPMGSLLQFVNAIAADIEKDYPNVRIDTLAYQYTRKPPKNLRPHKNVIVRLCSIECCFGHPLETCTEQTDASFRNDIMSWEPVAPLLYVWDYTPNFANYVMPFPNFDVLQPNIQFFARHGVKGLFEQGNYNGGNSGDLGALRSYLLAKLIWNPETDVKRHMQDFCNGYYGKAGPKIVELVEATQRPVRERKLHAHIYDSPAAAYYTPEVLAEAEKLLSEAGQLAENDTIKARVEAARLPFWYLQLAQNRVQGEARTALLRKFVATARNANVTMISEGQALDHWAKQQGVE